MTKRTQRVVAAALLVAAPALLNATPAAAAKPKKTVTVGDNFYKPKRFTVDVGDKVTWVFKGRAIHDVVVESGPAKFKSEKRGYGYKFSKVLKVAGTYNIMCTLHPSMTMTIKVNPKAPVVTTTSTAPTT